MIANLMFGLSPLLIIPILLATVPAAFAQPDPFADRYPDAPTQPPRERDLTVTGTVTLDGKPAAGVQLSDGQQIVTTGPDGRYRLAFHVSESRYVTLTRPTGTRPVGPWAAFIDPADARTEQTLDFALSSDPDSARARFDFLQTSDSQFTTPAEMAEIREDYAQITAMTGSPAFLVCPGDLTMNGTHYELDMYKELSRAATITLYDVFGGHDGNYGAPHYSTANYQRKIGPTNYSWNYGGVHFMAWITEQHYLSEEAKARQAAWIEADLAAQPPGTPILIVTHIPPDKALLSRWLDQRYNLIGVLFGHWHSISQNAFRGVPLLNCSPIRGGDWGQLTRAFRVNTIENGKLIASEVRPTGQYQRLEVVAPALDAVRFPCLLRVLAYDSSSRVKSVTATLSSANAAKPQITHLPLTRQGDWTWAAELPATLAQPATYQLTIRALDDLGREWTTAGELTPAPLPVLPAITSGADWPSLNGPEPAFRTSRGALKPPLKLSWVVNTGGRAQLTVSPIVYGHRVYVGVQAHDVGWRGAGVACYDAATGNKLWFTPLDSSVRFSPAVIAGVLVAVTHQGVVYGLDPRAGTRLWEYDLYPEPPSSIYRTVSKPVIPFDGEALVARDDSTAVLLDPATGSLLKSYPGRPGGYYAYPTGAGSTIYFGSRKICQAFDALSGKKLWDVAADTSKATSAPVLHDGRLYLCASQLGCYNPTDGALNWKRPLSVAGNALAAPVFYQNLVIANGARLLAFNRMTGEPAWDFPYPDPAGPHNRRQNVAGASAPVVCDDVLYTASDNGRLYALDAATGKELWSYHLGLPLKSWPAVSGNALYLTDFDGNLWAFVSTQP